ncbi:MAG: Fic family protein [Bernardetiaceae bacterium]|nr:Fic family protein [Bernardetiaceae bacterium]
MTKNKRFSQKINVFHGREAPETDSTLVGYGAVIDALELSMPLPTRLSVISSKHKKYNAEKWQVFTPRYAPQEELLSHLIFALKYEGIDLLFFKKLFQKIQHEELEAWIQKQPLSQYSRKLWFLYEWLTAQKLPIENLKSGNYVALLDEKKQFARTEGTKSIRHRIINNLIGTVNFCPIIYRTPKLEAYIAADFEAQKEKYFQNLSPQIRARTAAFLLLKDSKSSFTIEGESAKNQRIARWGRAIGEAGIRPLSEQELVALQKLIIGKSRFVSFGYRQKGGFIGEHDPETAMPIPEHISAKWQDLQLLMQGFFDTYQLLVKNDLDAVLCAAALSFGFVFIHPFEDGNGRLHRYLIHQIMAEKKFYPTGNIFPISAAILDKITAYRRVLEAHSHPLLEHIEWRETAQHNVEVLNNTIDFYRYFDATAAAEFLYDCLDYTLTQILPQEVEYLMQYDNFKTKISEYFTISDKQISLLLSFLKQNNGKLSKRAGEKEFARLTSEEVAQIEKIYRDCFVDTV